MSEIAGSPRAARRLPASLTLALLRMGIGWHFLYEGVVKLLDPQWSAAGYLRASVGPFADAFHRLSANESAMRVVDALNVWGLILIGGCLMLGLVIRFSSVCGIALLALYYAACPPLFSPVPPGAMEGQYLLVSKNLLEMLALAVIIAMPAREFGLDGIVFAWRSNRQRRLTDAEALPAAYEANGNPYLDPAGLSRRRILAGLMGSPVAGSFALAVMKKRGYVSFEEKNLEGEPDGRSGATKKFDLGASLKDLKGRLPVGQIKDVKLSRMIMGGNLIGGWAHARDLIYVSKLIKAYHHRQKVFETLRLAEACGVNTILTNPMLCDIINDYWRNTGGKIQFISDCGCGWVPDLVKKSIDNGACACYIQGAEADELVKTGQFDVIEESLDLIRGSGLPAGIGAHNLSTLVACVEKGFVPDFWVKTLHETNYWSAKPEPECDNIWCTDPAATVEFMGKLTQPWIAFKVLAAGAIHPKDGFKFAFQNGADFICVGMYDFQMVEDVNLALDVLDSKPERTRPWCA